jgi:CubicO group peptidase (beta-lactamase class C family)
MKKTLISFMLIAAIVLVVPPLLLGFSVWNLGSAVQVATGLGAKIACSARFISDLSEQQALADVVSYSPAAGLLDLTYDYDNKTVDAELFGMAPKRAQYRKGLGCTLDVGDTQHLNSIQVPEVASNEDDWPKGQGVHSKIEGVQQALDQMLLDDNEKGYQTRAFLVIKGQEIIAESYAEGFTNHTPLMGWSMGKSLTAMLVGRYQYLQQIDSEQLAGLEQWKEDGRSQITIKQLLQMTSGLKFDEVYAPGSDATHMLFSAYSASDVALGSPLDEQPGTHFSYSSGTTNILARWLFEELDGDAQQLVDFAFNELFSPLSMSNTVFEPDGSGVFVGSSYIYASARDWARLALLMKNGGEMNGQQLLSQEWVKQASQPNSSENDKRYGYQFWLNSGGEELRWKDLPKDAYAMLGNRKQVVMIIPSQDMIVIRLGWSSGDYPTNNNFSELIKLANP